MFRDRCPPFCIFHNWSTVFNLNYLLYFNFCFFCRPSSYQKRRFFIILGSTMSLIFTGLLIAASRGSGPTCPHLSSSAIWGGFPINVFCSGRVRMAIWLSCPDAYWAGNLFHRVSFGKPSNVPGRSRCLWATWPFHRFSWAGPNSGLSYLVLLSIV